MNFRQACLSLLGCFALVGCENTIHPDSQMTSETFRPIVEKEVATTIREYLAGFGTAKCEDVLSVSKFARDGMIYVTDTDIFKIPLSDYEQGIRDRACNWISHTGDVDSITVDVLSRDIAVAAWLYHDDVVLKSGEAVHTKGSVLMTLVRFADGWKITSTMSNDKRTP